MVKLKDNATSWLSFGTTYDKVSPTQKILSLLGCGATAGCIAPGIPSQHWELRTQQYHPQS